EEEENTWYKHAHQEDNLIVFVGKRYSLLYRPGYNNNVAMHVEVTPDRILDARTGEVLYDGPAVLCWPSGVYHQVNSGPEGSVSVNIPQRSEGFDINVEFNIWSLPTRDMFCPTPTAERDPKMQDWEDSEGTVARAGHLDQDKLIM
ncbi:hypothetical protein KIPB_009174, partial [Kipferlia bialata]